MGAFAVVLEKVSDSYFTPLIFVESDICCACHLSVEIELIEVSRSRHGLELPVRVPEPAVLVSSKGRIRTASYKAVLGTILVSPF